MGIPYPKSLLGLLVFQQIALFSTTRENRNEVRGYYLKTQILLDLKLGKITYYLFENMF